MTSSRQLIFEKLRRDGQPFPEAVSPATYRPMVPRGDASPAELKALFVREAEKAGCICHLPISTEDAVGIVLEVIGEDTGVSCWEMDEIPLPGLADALQERRIDCVGQDAAMRVGLTGSDAALAATGSLVLCSGKGRFRAPSLLPPVHVAVVTAAQILPDLERWWADQKTAGLSELRRSSNIVVITGPSRTADIAMELVMGMHGPGELHIVLLDSQV